MDSLHTEYIWAVILSFIIAFVLAFGIGANDVANSFGTSVGAKALTLRQACILASVFETLGAVFLGAKVSDTIRKGIIDIEPYRNETDVLLMGNLAALSGSCSWMLAATLLRLPVSATHSIVGATVGFAIVVHGVSGIRWEKLGFIIGSWFLSPILAGAVSTLIFFICKIFVLNKAEPLEPGLQLLPVFYAATIVINIFSVFYDGPTLFHMDKIPFWGTLIASVGAGIITAIVVKLVVVPLQRKKIIAECRQHNDEPVKENLIQPTSDSAYCSQNGSESSSKSNSLTNSERNLTGATDKPDIVNVEKGCTTLDAASITDKVVTIPEAAVVATENNHKSDKHSHHHQHHLEGRSTVHDHPEAAKLFSNLQILTAIFGAFAHGGNDVSNAIGPLISVWLIATTGSIAEKADSPMWILLYGGVGISIGLWVLGRRVIKTMGEDLTKITPSSGFCIEIGSALTVLVASNVGLPISTTHCKVGSVVFVGRFRARENVDWSIFRNIVLAWLVTLPISGGISAAIMKVLQQAVGF